MIQALPLYFLHPHTKNQTTFLEMTAINKSTAAKILVLWNLPALLLLAGAFNVVSTVTV